MATLSPLRPSYSTDPNTLAGLDAGELPGASLRRNAETDAASGNALTNSFTGALLTNQANTMGAEESSLRARGDPNSLRRAGVLRNEIESIQRQAGAYAAPIQKYEDIHSLGDAGSWFAGQVGQGFGSSIGMLASGSALGGASTLLGMVPNPMAKLASMGLRAASVGVPYAQNVALNKGEGYNGIQDDPVAMARTPQEIDDAMSRHGYISGAMDTLPQLLPIGQIGGGFGKVLKKIPTPVKLMGEPLMEGVTETGQQISQHYAHEALNPNRDTKDDRSENINSFLGGMAGSVGMTGVGHVAEKIGHRLTGEAGNKSGKSGDNHDLGGAPAYTGEMSQEDMDKVNPKMPAGYENDHEKFAQWLSETDAAAVPVVRKHLDEHAKTDPVAAELAKKDLTDSDALDDAKDYLLYKHKEASSRKNLQDMVDLSVHGERTLNAQSNFNEDADKSWEQWKARRDEIDTANKALPSDAFAKTEWTPDEVASAKHMGIALTRLAEPEVAARDAVNEDGTTKAVTGDRAEPAKHDPRTYIQGLLRDVAYEVAGLGRVANAKDYVSTMGKARIANIVQTLQTGTSGKAAEAIDKLRSLSSPRAAPLFDAMETELRQSTTPAGDLYTAAIRKNAQDELLRAIGPEKRLELEKQGVGLETHQGRDTLLKMFSVMAQGSANPRLRPHLNELLGKDTVNKLLATMNIGEKEKTADELVHEQGGVHTVDESGNDHDEVTTTKGSTYADNEAAANVRAIGKPMYGYHRSGSDLTRTNREGKDEWAGQGGFLASTLSTKERTELKLNNDDRVKEGLPPLGITGRPGLFEYDEKGNPLDTVWGTKEPTVNRTISEMEKKLGVDRSPANMARLLREEGNEAKAKQVEQWAQDPTKADKLAQDMDAFFANRAGGHRVTTRPVWDLLGAHNVSPSRALSLHHDYVSQDVALLASQAKNEQDPQKAKALQAKAQALREGVKNTQAALADIIDGGKRLTPAQTEAAHEAAKKYFQLHRVVVAEQMSNRDSERMTPAELMKMSDMADRAESHLRVSGKHIGDANILNFQSPSAEAGRTLSRHKDGHISIVAGDLVKWVRERRGESEKGDVEQDRKSANYSAASKNQAYLDDLLTGITTLMDSGLVAPEMPTKLNRENKVETFNDMNSELVRIANAKRAIWENLKNQEGADPEKVAEAKEVARAAAKEATMKKAGAPASLMLHDTTVGDMMFGRSKRKPKAADGETHGKYGDAYVVGAHLALKGLSEQTMTPEEWAKHQALSSAVDEAEGDIAKLRAQKELSEYRMALATDPKRLKAVKAAAKEEMANAPDTAARNKLVRDAQEATGLKNGAEDEVEKEHNKDDDIFVAEQREEISRNNRDVSRHHLLSETQREEISRVRDPAARDELTAKFATKYANERMAEDGWKQDPRYKEQSTDEGRHKVAELIRKEYTDYWREQYKLYGPTGAAVYNKKGLNSAKLTKEGEPIPGTSRARSGTTYGESTDRLEDTPLDRSRGQVKGEAPDEFSAQTQFSAMTNAGAQSTGLKMENKRQAVDQAMTNAGPIIDAMSSNPDRAIQLLRSRLRTAQTDAFHEGEGTRNMAVGGPHYALPAAAALTEERISNLAEAGATDTQLRELNDLRVETARVVLEGKMKTDMKVGAARLLAGLSKNDDRVNTTNYEASLQDIVGDAKPMDLHGGESATPLTKAQINSNSDAALAAFKAQIDENDAATREGRIPRDISLSGLKVGVPVKDVSQKTNMVRKSPVLDNIAAALTKGKDGGANTETVTPGRTPSAKPGVLPFTKGQKDTSVPTKRQPWTQAQVDKHTTATNHVFNLGQEVIGRLAAKARGEMVEEAAPEATTSVTYASIHDAYESLQDTIHKLTLPQLVWKQKHVEEELAKQVDPNSAFVSILREEKEMVAARIAELTKVTQTPRQQEVSAALNTPEAKAEARAEQKRLQAKLKGTEHQTNDGTAKFGATEHQTNDGTAKFGATEGTHHANVPMNFTMPNEGMIGALRGKYPNGATTAELMANGDRTATTRSYALGKVGDTFDVGDGNTYRITKVAPVKFDTELAKGQWSKAEGWNFKYAEREHGQQVHDGAIQTTFEKVEGKAKSVVTAVREEAKPAQGVSVVEHQSPGYRERTKHNADSAGLTVAIAADYGTAGERLTKSVAGDKYLAIPLDVAPDKGGVRLAKAMRQIGTTTLNVAGNGIYTLASDGHTQASINQHVYDLIAAAHKLLPITKIVTGGQTGVDLAGAVAAHKLGIPVAVTMPKGFVQRNAMGKDAQHTAAQIQAQITEGATALGKETPKAEAPKAEAPKAEAPATPRAFIDALKKVHDAVVVEDHGDETKSTLSALTGQNMNLTLNGDRDEIVAGYRELEKSLKQIDPIGASPFTEKQQNMVSYLMKRIRDAARIDSDRTLNAQTNDTTTTAPQAGTIASVMDTDAVYKAWSNVQDGTDRATMRDQMAYVQKTYSNKVTPENREEARKELAKQFKWFRSASQEQQNKVMDMLAAPTTKPVQDPLVSGPLAPADNEEMKQARAWADKTLASDIRVAFKNITGYSGEWLKTDRIVEIARNAAAGIMGAMHHEGLHAFFTDFIEAHPQAQEMFKGITENKELRERVHALLDGFPAAQAQLAKPQEMLAYTFQFWKGGALELPYGKPKTLFQKVLKLFRRVLGSVSDYERATDVLDAFDKGSFKEQDAGKAALVRIMGQGTWTLKARRDMDRIMQRMGALTMANEETYATSESPAIRALGHLYYTNPGDEKTGAMKEGYIQARQHQARKFINYITRAMQDFNTTDMNAVVKYMQAETPEGKIPYAPHRKAVQDIRSTMDDIYRYATQDRGLQMDYAGKHGYYPVTWSTRTLGEKHDAFIEMLTQPKYAGELQAIMKAVPGLDSPEAAADAVHGWLMAREGMQQQLAVEKDNGVLTPYFANEEKRKLNWIEAADREPFLSKNLISTLSKYVNNVVHAAEYTHRFGRDGEHLEEMMRKGREELEAASKKRMAAGEFKSEKARTDWLARQIRDVEHANAAMEGSLGKDTSDNVRKLNSYLMVYQNYRKLATSLFSSFGDPLGMVANGAPMKMAFKAWLGAMTDVVHEWANMFRQEKKKYPESYFMKLAQMTGAIEHAMIAHHVSEESSMSFMDRRSKNLNNMLFKANGMEAYDRGMRAGAMEGAYHFLLNHKGLPEKHSKRWLANLGVTPDQIPVNAQGHLIVTPGELMASRGQEANETNMALARKDIDRVHNALNRWVESAILSPSAATRPAWASDPAYASIFHMKQFTYSWHQIIRKHALQEYDHGNIAPMGALAGMVPVLMASNIMKGMFLGLGTLPAYMKDMTLNDHIQSAVRGAGLGGVHQMGIDALAHPFKLGGPTIDQVTGWFLNDKTLSENVFDATPLQQLTTGFVRP